MAPNEAISRLQEVQLTYEKRIDYIDKLQNQLRAQAKQALLEGKRHTALSRLKQCKLYDKHLTALTRWNDTVMTLRTEIEQTILMAATVDGMRQGAQTLGLILKKVDPKEMDSLVDEVSEHMHVSQDLIETISRAGEDWQSIQTNGGVQAFDEEELERELDQLREDSPPFSNISKITAKQRDAPSEDEENMQLLKLDQSMRMEPPIGAAAQKPKKNAESKQPLLLPAK